jgi:hypothetical protein
VDTQADIAAVLEHPLASQLHDREALRLLRDWRESGGDDPAGT